MAWQPSRSSLTFCKRYERKFRPQFISESFHEKLQGFLTSVDSNNFPKPAKINFSGSDRPTTGFDKVAKQNWSSCSPENPSSTSGFSRNQVRGHFPPLGTSAGVIRVRSPDVSPDSSSKLCRVFCSVSRSTSHHLERLQELPPIIGNRHGERMEPDIVSTEDVEGLYSGMTASELLFTLVNLQLVTYEPVVNLGIKALKSSLMSFPLYEKSLLAMVKRTAYAHFCAGQNVTAASKTLQRMWELGLKSILDYSLEDAMNNSSCDSNLEGFLQTVDRTKLFPFGSVSFACVKMTALCPLPLLEKISKLLRWQHMHVGYRLPWREDVLPLLADVSPMYHARVLPEPLTVEEERDLHLAKNRLWSLCRACHEASLPLLIDAEYTSVQPAIDYYTYIAASEFNRQRSPLVYGTIQAYLKDSLPRLSMAADEAAKRKMSFGVKLVRGAYINRESALAASLGAESPIHSCIEETHECYDECAAFMMERVVQGQGAVVLATHNFDSGRAAAVKADELGLLKGDPHLQFAQLKGMADGLSLALAHAGFQVSKYLPFGPVEHVMPYLIRRAEENRGLLGNTLTDRVFMRQELTRRLLSFLRD